MKQIKKNWHNLPPVGLRMVKSAVCVFLCFLFCWLRGEQSTPFYVVLAGLWCIQPDIGNSKVMGARRLLGTLIGAVFGMVILLFELKVWPIHGELMGYFVASVMIIPIIYTTVLIGKTEAAYYSCVVFLSVTITHLTDSNPYLFVWNRALDTAIGLGVGLLVNSAHIPRKYQKETLFVLQLEQALLGEDGQLTPYGKVELNKMLDYGARVTVSTAQTPATLMPPLREIRLSLPVIAMDGAVLYDIRSKTFLYSYVISPAMTKDLGDFLNRHGYHHFTNVVMEDMLVIYYQDFSCPEAETVYQTMRTSPYRNYVRMEVPEDASAVYFLVIADKEKMDALAALLEQAGYADQLKLSYSRQEEFPDAVFLRIYSQNASISHMREYLQEETEAKTLVTIGTSEEDTVRVPAGFPNKTVRSLKRSFEPFFWRKTKPDNEKMD